MKITFAANMYWAMKTDLCKMDMNLDLLLIELLDEFMNFSKKLCPSMYAADTIRNKIIPLEEVLKSIKKFATVALTFANISRESKPKINTENLRLDFIK